MQPVKRIIACCAIIFLTEALNTFIVSVSRVIEKACVSQQVMPFLIIFMKIQVFLPGVTSSSGAGTGSMSSSLQM